MLTLVNILIIFFIFLILYQIFLATKIIEGMDNSTYTPYDTNNPNNTLILAQQNAGNIEYLRKRIDLVQGMNQQVQDLSGNVQSLQTQVNGLVQAQKDYADQMTGGTAPDISGTTPEEGTSVQDTSNLITE
jgi:TolA-binding protein